MNQYGSLDKLHEGTEWCLTYQSRLVIHETQKLYILLYIFLFGDLIVNLCS